MNIETMLYVYLAVCVSMICFNIVTAFVLKKKDQRTEKVSKSFKKEVQLQLERITLGEKTDEKHKSYLRKKLRRVGNMVAFDKMLEEAYLEDAQNVKKYLLQLDSVFISLTADYFKRNSIEATYFPYIIKKYRLIAFRPSPAIEGALLKMLNEPSLYLRENVMQALYTTGNCDTIMKAIKILDKSELFFHGKLLCDGLLNFSGNVKALNKSITDEFKTFSKKMQINLLNYLRLSTPDYKEFAFSILTDPKEDDELRFGAIRYLGKFPYEKAYHTLCELADFERVEKWEYSAISSTALASYPHKETVNLLKKNLYSPDWYIRLNSAQSLEKLGVTYKELADVLDGNDRYASEILRYRLQKSNEKERSLAHG